jgi:hypothetical protein
MPGTTTCLGLLRRRKCPVPTVRGWALLLLGLAGLAVLAMRRVYPFLAVTDPRPDGVLVVDGSMADYELNEAKAEFQRHHYEKLYVVGGPLLAGGLLAKYPDYAAMGADTLLNLGLGTNSVQAVPATRAQSDSIYHDAVCLAEWLHAHGARPVTVNVLTEGPTARRARLMFEKALGDGVRVGVVALPPRGYDPDRWWRSSEGVRTVTGEVLGYGYARLFVGGSKE